jgi:hypothetical protein
MHNHHTAIRNVFALSLAIVAAACGSGDERAPSGDEIATQVDSELGGVTPSDEAASFGDATLATAEFTAEDAAVADPTAERPDLAGARRVRIAIAWGYLRPHRDASEAIDWSGAIVAENAALRVLRKLRFEDDDLVIRPRTDVSVVEFESHTRPHADGLLLEVILAPSLNPANGPVTLTFSTAPYTHTLTIEAGMRLSDVVEVDDAGHVVAYHIIRPDASPCTEGFLRGRWSAAGEVAGHAVGRLFGRFIASDGSIRGHVRGVFGERANGKKVWFAKAIDKDGRFLGVLLGRYGDGHFGGLFIGGDRIVKGVVRGHYRDGDGDRDGAFMGRYSERCGEDPAEGSELTTDEPEVALEDAA